MTRYGGHCCGGALAERQPVAFEFDRITVRRADRRVLDEVTAWIPAAAAPFQAVVVQAVVMFLVLAATATTTTVIALGLIRRLFTPDHRLVYLPAPADH